MKSGKRSRKVMAGLLAFLLIFQMMYTDGKLMMTAEAETQEEGSGSEEEGGQDSGNNETEKDSYTFLVTEQVDTQNTGDDTQNAGDDTQNTEDDTQKGIEDDTQNTEEGTQDTENDTQTSVPIAGANIVIKDSNNQQIGEILTTNENGEAVLEVDKDTDISIYTYTVTEKNHIAQENIPMENVQPGDTISVSMEIQYVYTIAGTVIQKESTDAGNVDTGSTESGNVDAGNADTEIQTSVPVKGATITFYGESNDAEGEEEGEPQEWTATTDEDGRFQVEVTFAKEQTSMNWRAEKIGYARTEGSLEKGTVEIIPIAMTALEQKNISITVTVPGESEDKPEAVTDAEVILKGYSLPEDGEILSVNEDGKYTFSNLYAAEEGYTVTIKKVGYIVYKAEVTKDMMEQAADGVVEVSAGLQKFGFETPSPEPVAWTTDSFENSLSSTIGSIEAKYSIIEGIDGSNQSLEDDAMAAYASIDEKTGKVTIKDLSKAEDITINLPVTLTIQAENIADGAESEYEKASYQLTITKAAQTLEWTTEKMPADKILYYGMTDISLQADAVEQGKGTVTYEVTEGTEYISIDENGKLSYLKEVEENSEISVTIKAKKEADNLYDGAESTYDFQLKRKTAVNSVKLNGSKYENNELVSTSEEYLENGGNGWFAGETLTISKEGYTVSTSAALDSTWTDSISLTGENYNGDSNSFEKSFYLRDTDGSISQEIILSGIQWDNTAPDKLSVQYSEADNLIERVLNKIKSWLRYYSEKTITVTISAEDTGSGIDYFEWKYISSQENTDENSTDDNYNKIEIKPENIENGVATVSFEIVKSDELEKNDSIAIDFNAYDKAGNRRNFVDEKNEIIYDKTPPSVGISFDKETPDFTQDENGKAYYKGSRTATITVTEKNFDAAGVDLTISAKDASAKDIAGETTVCVGEENEISIRDLADKIKDPGYWTTDGNEHSITITFDKDAYYSFCVQAKDLAMNTSSEVESGEFYVDAKAPIMKSVKYNEIEDSGQTADILYFNKDVEVTFIIEETNFDSDKVTIVKKADNSSTEENVAWTQESGTDTWTGSITLKEEGEYTLTAECEDIAGNEMETFTSKTLVIDKTEPDVQVTYNEDNDFISSEKGNIYKKERTATITVTEKNFDAAGVALGISASDFADTEITNATCVIKNKDGKTSAKVSVNEIAKEIKDSNYWTTNGNEHSITITFDEDAFYKFSVKAKDLAGWESNTIEGKFGIDVEKPTNLNISYSKPIWKKVLEKITFGFYKSSVTVTFTAQDMVSGVDHMEWSYEKETNSSSVNVESKTGIIEADKITYDGTTAKAETTLTAEEAAQYRGHLSFTVWDKAGRSNAYSDETYDVVVDNIRPVLKKVEYNQINETGKNLYFNGKAVVTFTIEEANFYPENVKIKANGTEVTGINWKNKNGTDEWTGVVTLEKEGDYVVTAECSDYSGNKMDSYTSKTLVIDRTKAEISIDYDNTEARNNNYYKNQRTATIRITEKNFNYDGIKVTAAAKDITGSPMVNAKVILGGKTIKLSDLPAEMKKSEYWSKTGTEYKTTIIYQEDAHYNFKIQAVDLAKNPSESKASDFWIDKTSPCDLEISYSTPILEKILETITFGYYQSSVEVTMTARDITSGIDTFSWNYNQEANTSLTNINNESGSITSEAIAYSDNGRTAAAAFRLTAQEAAKYRGNIFFTVTDRAGNQSALQDNEHQIVVDDIAPGITVDYAPVNQEGSKAYFNGTAVINFHVTEANFYQEDMVIRVNGEETVCNNWLQESGTDNWNGSIALTADGDYEVIVEYQDRSANKMNTYTSPILVVDTTKPVIHVTYDNNNVIYSENGNDYFNQTRTATIQITDKNFRAEEVEAVITAVKMDGTSVEVEDYSSYLKQSASWRKSGDTYTATISYKKDANYTFDISYTDMAKNDAADYAEEHFTVDTTAPVNLQISYSDSILETVLENITFGFYNAKMTVTITAEDDVSGIHHFIYSYKNAENVSGVNGQLIEQQIGREQITYSNGKKTATAQFTIPKSELDGNNQFNGMVEFDAVDSSSNQTHTADNKRIVVDNIAPTVEVTYNTPTSSANGIDYYAESVNGQITITEANFRSEDVEVSATKDGAPYALSVSWNDVNADVHNGSFNLSEDGDYQITVNYQDKSGNTMTVYQSNQLTVDSTTPTITVEEIANGTAYNQEIIGLKVLVDDVNFDISSFQPLLSAVVWEESGSFHVKDYSELGEIQTIEEGKTYAYVIENIPEDAIYTLSCTVKDLSLHEISEMTVTDSGNELMESIMFSVNRNGSTFMLNADTQALVENYYVPMVEEDIVMQEINCDPVIQHEVAVNGQALQENSQYRVVDNRGENTWYQYDYVIEKDVFEQEGSYAVVIATTDKAENAAYSDMKNVEASFVVDRTEPVVTVSGLADNGRYQVEAQTVNVIPTDDGGKLESLQISIYDSNNALVKNAVSYSGTEFLETMEADGGKVVFEIPQGVNQRVSVTCTDAAGNIYEKEYKNVTVSTEWYIMLFANKPLFYGGIAGIVVLGAAGIFVIAWKRRKKQNSRIA